MEKYFLDPYTKFSKSHLWKLQEIAYKTFGPSAWSKKGVPFYLTSCPYTAHLYFEMAKGFYKDLPEKSPLTLFDLGCGTGRFAYYFLKEWQKEKPFPLTYVMVDIVDANLDFSKTHPLLKPFLGILKFVNEPYVVKTPVIMVANYFFDTIPQDLFRVNGGLLEEGLVALTTDERVEDREDPRLIDQLSLEFSFKPYKASYENKKWDLILENLKNEFQEKTFLFPVGALKTVDDARKITDKPILFLAADQTLPSLKHHIEAEDPKITIHSTFSVPVSYYILEMYFDRAFLSPFSAKEFTVMAGVLSKDEYYMNLEAAYESTIEVFDPYAYLLFVEKLEKGSLSLSEWINLIRLGHFDPMTLNANFKKIRHAVKENQTVTSVQMVVILRKCFENIYPLSEEEGHVIKNFGVLALEMGEKEEANFYFEEAKKLLENI